MTDGVLNVYKKEGETPLERLERLRYEIPQYKDATLSYAGRLDPMAEGVMLVLVGEHNKRREEYLHLDKTYEIEILWGFETDTHDVLGKVMRVENTNSDLARLAHVLNTYTGTIIQTYPIFSSKPAYGVNTDKGRRSLFELARRGEIDKNTIPEKEVRITSIDAHGSYMLRKAELSGSIEERIDTVRGDFRQEEIKKKWKNVLAEMEKDSFTISRFCIECSSGAYMRMLAHDLGVALGTRAIAYKIMRTKVGKHDIQSSFR